MSVFVSEIYKLSALKGAKILTGESGFQNPVSRVSILDHEFCSDKAKDEFIKNDFIITSFLFAKDDLDTVCETIEILIGNGVSMLGIKDVYYQKLPEAILDYASQHEFSIFLFGRDTYYENIITETADMLRLAERSELIETKVDRLLREQFSDHTKRQAALNINSMFYDQFAVLFCETVNWEKRVTLYRTLERLKQLEYFHSSHTVFKYGNGLMAVLTFPRGHALSPRSLYHEFIGKTNLSATDYFTGVSDVFPTLHTLDSGIRQSLYACRISRLRGRSVTLFHDIGLYQLILPNLDSHWLDRYCSDIIDPILNYDREHEGDLLATAVAYVEQDGNIKKTAEELFQHENTIRYRIRKLRELLNMTEESANFYPQLCVAVQTYLLKREAHR